MRRVLAAEFAELVVFQTSSGRLLVLGRRVVTVLTITALQRNDFSHDPISHSPTLAESVLVRAHQIRGMRRPTQTTS